MQKGSPYRQKLANEAKAKAKIKHYLAMVQDKKEIGQVKRKA